MLAAARRHPRLLIAAVVLIAALAVLLAGRSGGAGSPDTAQAAAKTLRIDMKNMAFSKKTVTVKVGTRITWTNRDSMKHDAYSSKSGGPKSPLLSKGKSYTWTAKKAGTYNYLCNPHASFMKGKIIVK